MTAAPIAPTTRRGRATPRGASNRLWTVTALVSALDGLGVPGVHGADMHG